MHFFHLFVWHQKLFIGWGDRYGREVLTHVCVQRVSGESLVCCFVVHPGGSLASYGFMCSPWFCAVGNIVSSATQLGGGAR